MKVYAVALVLFGSFSCKPSADTQGQVQNAEDDQIQKRADDSPQKYLSSGSCLSEDFKIVVDLPLKTIKVIPAEKKDNQPDLFEYKLDVQVGSISGKLTLEGHVLIDEIKDGEPTGRKLKDKTKHFTLNVDRDVETLSGKATWTASDIFGSQEKNCIWKEKK